MQESSTRSLWGRAVVAPFLVALLILALWVYAKCVLFDKLEYTADIFDYLFMSRSVFQGLGLLWEPQFHGLIHHFALMPAWYPFTWWLGAYGLFAGHALLMLAVIVGISSDINRSEAWRRELSWTVLFALVLGPVGFWLWDNPIYGWHAEVVFLPLSILFASGLARRSRIAWLWGAMLIVNREEGALIAWAVHALFVMMDASTNVDGSTDASRRRRRVRLARLTAAYLAVFAANVALLLARQPSAVDSRIGLALARVPALWSDVGLRMEMWRAVSAAFGLWLTGAVVALAILRVRWVLLVALVTMPLVAVEAFGTLAYDVDAMRYHGVEWPPRFAMFWGPLIAGSVFSIRFATAPVLRHRTTRVGICVVVAVSSLGLQASALNSSRKYDMVARLESVAGRGPRLGASALSAREDRVMRCLGARLPSDTKVAVPAFLEARFHRQLMLWGQRSAHVVVCDEARPSRWSIATTCLPRPSLIWATQSVLVDQLAVAFSPGLRPVVEPCLADGTHASSAGSESGAQGSANMAEPVDAVASVQVTVNVVGAGTGHVRRADRPDCPLGTCDATYPLGTVVELRAVPALGSLFAGWSGDCASPNFATELSLTSSKTCTAAFQAAPAATKLAPARGATVDGSRVLLRWQPVAGAHYFVCVAQAPITTTCETGFQDATVPQMEQSGLAPGVYFWQVRAWPPAGRFDLDGVSWEFTVPLPRESSWWAPCVLGPGILVALALGMALGSTRMARRE
jgi:hypothetical protein